MSAAVAAVEEAEGAVGAPAGTTPATARAAHSRRSPSRTCGASSRPTSSACCGCASSCRSGMRRQGYGRIVNVSSMGGKLTFPGGGVYHATKHAVEALSDALRFEVQGFGVDVAIIEPGLIRTNFAETAVGSVSYEDGPYAEFNNSRVGRTPPAPTTERSASSRGSEKVARAIERAITSRRPRTRYPVTASARLFIGQHAVLPDRAWDRVVGNQLPARAAARISRPTSRTPTRSMPTSASCSRTSPRTTSSLPKFRKANTVVQYQYREPDSQDHGQADRRRGRSGGLRFHHDGARGGHDDGRRHGPSLLARQGQRDRGTGPVGR